MSEKSAHGVVLVEGRSDRNAVEALARGRGLDLSAFRVSVVSMDGATNIAKHVQRHRSLGRAGRLAGLCDSAEAPLFVRALEEVGLGSDLRSAGFFVCEEDLEDELIRAIGAQRVAQLIEEEGEGEGFARFQMQPHQRGRSLAAQVHRFAGVKSGRKARYGGLLAEALTEESIPEPLRLLIDRIQGWMK